MPYAVGEYYERVNDYDLEYQSQSEQDLPFWRELVMRYTPTHVLELACGSGRIGQGLLHIPGNFTLEGLDIEPAMLTSYQKILAREPAELQRRVILHQGNMSTYDLPHKGLFDLILLPFNSICHLYEIDNGLLSVLLMTILLLVVVSSLIPSCQTSTISAMLSTALRPSTWKMK